jgi:hypothetical protein
MLSVAAVLRIMKTHGTLVELSGQTIEADTVDPATVQIVGGDDRIRLVRGSAATYSIEGYEIG